MEKSIPAAYPENGPRRLAVDRTPEQRDYDRSDWQGSDNFHPPHFRKLGQEMLDTVHQSRAEEPNQSVDFQPE